MNRRPTRRKLLEIGGASVMTLAAGCSAFDDEPADETRDDGHVHEAEHSDNEGDHRDPNLRIDDRYLSSAFPVEFVEPEFDETAGFGGDSRIVYVHWHGVDVSHWHQSPLELTAGETRFGRTRFLLEGPTELSIGPNEPFSQTVRAVDGTADGLVMIETDADHVDLTATGTGEVEMVFELWAGDDRRWVSPPLPVEIV